MKKTALSKSTFFIEFEHQNLSLYYPKKGRCDTCVQYETGNLPQEEWKEHMAQNRANNEKSNDKIDAMKGKCHVICMDLQAVKTCPVVNSSSM